ncbi:methyltransferase domain-containing protein [Halomarina oriensis]|uniref:class I SAM-dependent methyltransferase n=1 Tax=Halomarina oriensis TaxID=671145 RepID=UPI0034A18838
MDEDADTPTTTGPDTTTRVRGQRLYDRWSDHQTLFRLGKWVVFAGREDAYRRQTLAGLNARRGDTVLDVGCGPGVDLPALRERVGPEGRVVGVDYSKGMVERAQRRIDRADWSNVHVVRGDASHLPLPAESVDRAYATLSLSAMPDLPGVLNAVAETLVPGGRLAVFDTRPFQTGYRRALNPLLVRGSWLLTNWHPDVGLLEPLRERFDRVAVETFDAGATVVAVAHRR